MAIQIGARPDSGFDDPIGMLKDCHRRIEHLLNILCIVVERAAGRAMKDEEIAAVRSALSYFRTGGQRHTADEEESLFPRLRAQLSADAWNNLSGLESDHHEASDLHSAADTLYTAWIEFGSLISEDEQRLLLIANQLKHLYREHIQVEENTVFPRAAALLDSETLAAIGKEFRARRE
jgi:hemerythrin-like domain-containing protein